MPHHFSWRPHSAHLITWLSWQEALDKARAEDRPVFLCLTAPWCRFCQAFDEQTLSDHVVIRLLNRSFVPTRVDVNERPDIARRYSAGGWPTAAFLTPEGELLTGIPAVTGAELVTMANSVLEVWQSNRDELRDEVAELQVTTALMLKAMREQPARRELTQDFLGMLLGMAVDAYDEEYGGFGTGMKFPRPDILSTIVTALELPGDQVENSIRQRAKSALAGTIEAIVNGALRDDERGGFFRYARTREWQEPHREKLLSDNAAIAAAIARVSLLWKRADLISVLQDTYDFIDSSLKDPGSDLYGAYLPAYDLGETLPPNLLGPTYAGPNAELIRALVDGAQAAKLLGAPVKTYDYLLAKANQVAQALRSRLSTRGLIKHCEDGPDLYLDDQVPYLEALLALDRACPDAAEWRERALDFWGAIDRYFSVAGESALLADVAAPVQVPEETRPYYRARTGRLGRTETPLDLNAKAAACLAKLATSTGDATLHSRAVAILEQLAPDAPAAGTYAIELVRAALELGYRLSSNPVSP